MADIVERLRQRPWRSAAENDYEAKERRQREREEGAETITALRAEVERLKAELEELDFLRHEGGDESVAALEAENERLRAYALKAFTVVEFCCGKGFILEPPFYDCDDLLLEGVNLLNVETSEEARTALEEKP